MNCPYTVSRRVRVGLPARVLPGGLDSATTGVMPAANTKLTTAVEDYLTALRRIRASGGATGERSYYGPLEKLLNAVGNTLKPRVFCVSELADQGAGHPDFGLYTAKQVQKGQPKEGQVPEYGVVEVKPTSDNAWLTAASALRGYRLSQMDNLNITPLPFEIFCNQPAVAVFGLVLTA